MGIKDFINQVKEKNEKFQKEQKEKHAQGLGFSSRYEYEYEKGKARQAGIEKGKKELRSKELKQIEQAARLETTGGGKGRTGGYIDKFQHGIQQYNKAMTGLRSVSGSGYGNSKQSYASGYGPYPSKRQREPQTLGQMLGYEPMRTRRRRSKKSKNKKSRRRKSKQGFNDVYSWARQF